MNFSSHAKHGLTAGAIVAVTGSVITNDVQLSGLAGLLTFAGAIAPDLDTDSIPSRWAARIGFFGGLVLLYFQQTYVVAWAGILFFLVKSDKHRGFTHKCALPTIIFIIAIIVKNWFCAWFALGLCVHLRIGDKLKFLDQKNWF